MGYTEKDRKTKRLDLRTEDIPIFELVVTPEVQEPQLPQLVWAEVNALALPFAVLNESEAKKSTGHEISKINVRDGKAVRWCWKVWPEPGVGMPTMLSLQVLFVIMQIAAEKKQQIGHVPQTLEIGSFNELCRRLSFPEDGRHRALVKQHIKILVSTQCKSEGAFKNKQRDGLFINTFKYIRAAGFVGEPGYDGTRVERNYVVFDDPVWANLNTQYIKQIDLTLMRQLRSPIAQLLYTKLSHLFHESQERGDACVEIEYEWLAERLGLKKYEQLFRAKSQLKQPLLELKEQCYIESFEWSGWQIRITPGVRYTFGEDQPRKERFRAIEGKNQYRQPVTSKINQQAQTSDDHKQTVLLIQAGRLMIGQTPDQNKLSEAGWTIADAQAKAEEIKQTR
jgi:hypothetical protein